MTFGFRTVWGDYLSSTLAYAWGMGVGTIETKEDACLVYIVLRAKQ
jgi:hypothetical protein